MQVTENAPQAQGARPKRRKDILAERTAKARQLVESGKYPNINSALLAMYKELDELPEHTEFKLFGQWKKDGFKIKKGSKGYPVWGAPKEHTKQDGTTYEFFPVAYLFSEFQVEPQQNLSPNPQTLNA